MIGEPFPTKEQLLIEYQAAQRSAEHHDTIVWRITSIMWASNLVLLGLILNVDIKAVSSPLYIGAGILGVFTMAATIVFTGHLRKMKIFKYERCKDIEKQFGLTQHSGYQWKGSLGRNLHVGISGLFILVWTGVLISGFILFERAGF